MQQLLVNQFEKIARADFNNAQAAMAQLIQDQVLYPYLQFPSGGVIGTSFTPTYVSAFAASLALGTGFFFDNTQSGFNPQFRMIRAVANIAVTIAANSNASNRIDLVCLAPNYAVTSTASRYVKTGGTGPITLTTVNKVQADTYTLQVVVGTPSGSPAVPATPAGYIAIAQVLNHGSSAGMSVGAADVTDVRTPLTNAAIVNIGPVAIAANTVIGRAHQGKFLNVNSTAGAISLTLPTGAGFAGFQFALNDIKGTFGANNVSLIPQGTDTIMGLNSTYLLQANWGSWNPYFDGAAWLIK